MRAPSNERHRLEVRAVCLDSTAGASGCTCFHLTPDGAPFRVGVARRGANLVQKHVVVDLTHPQHQSAVFMPGPVLTAPPTEGRAPTPTKSQSGEPEEEDGGGGGGGWGGGCMK